MILKTATFLLFGVCLLAAPLDGRASEPPKDKKKLSATWTVTVSDKVVGEETLRLIVKADGRRFMSFLYKPVKKSKKRSTPPYQLSAMLWRDAGGQLTKYERSERRRLGEGVRVFRRGSKANIVGINARKTMTTLDLSDQVIADPLMLGTMWDWLPRLRLSAEEQSLSFIHVATRGNNRAVVRKGETRELVDRKGQLKKVSEWTVMGPKLLLTLLLDDRQRMVGALHGDRALLLKGWKWEVPAPEPPESTPPASDANPASSTADK